MVITTKATTILVVLLVVLLFVSFCLSGAETAFFSLTFKDVNYLKTKPQTPYKRIITLLEEPTVLLGALLMANCFASIGIVIVGDYLLTHLLQMENWWLTFAIKLVALASLILLFAQILPRTFAAQNNVRFAKDVGWITEAMYLLFRLPASWVAKNSDSLETRLGKRSKSVTREEMHAAIDLTTPQKEQDILKGILDFGDKIVKQVMISRLDVIGIEFKTDFFSLKKKVEDLHYSRLPVYNGSLDEIKGMIHTKDLLPHLNKNTDFDWHTLMRPAFFVHEQKLIEDLMKEFQQKRIHFAVVADEFGGTSGIVTLEDILEEVIGEITDEFDEVETGNKKLDNANYLFEGKTMLNDVCKIMGIPTDTFDEVKGESDSLAGLLLELAGEIPSTDQIINTDGFAFSVLEVNKNRIQKVKVTIKEGAAE